MLSVGGGLTPTPTRPPVPPGKSTSCRNVADRDIRLDGRSPGIRCKSALGLSVTTLSWRLWEGGGPDWMGAEVDVTAGETQIRGGRGSLRGGWVEISAGYVVGNTLMLGRKISVQRRSAGKGRWVKSFLVDDGV